MARSRVQFQKGYSLVQFMDEYGSEEKCIEALFRWRWPNGRFDIAPRQGYWMAKDDWEDVWGRAVDIYVFAWHPETSKKLADQRDPGQWMFYVVRTEDLPPAQKSIGLAGIEEACFHGSSRCARFRHRVASE